ncbi:MAG: hypothetical protein ACRCX2_30805 [Paraclostridium sp.]
MSEINQNRPISNKVCSIEFTDRDINASYKGVPLYSMLAEDGFIYSIVESPTNAQLRRLDTDTLVDTLYCNLGPFVGGCGLIQASNGKIYTIPDQSTQIMEIDLDNKTVFHFGALAAGKTRMYYCAHLAPNGNFYMIPYTASSVVEVDPFKKTMEYVGDFSFSGYIGCVMGKDGKIYSFKNQKVLIVDPTTKIVIEEDLKALENFIYKSNTTALSCCVTTTGEILILWSAYSSSSDIHFFISHFNPITKAHTFGSLVNGLTSYRHYGTHSEPYAYPNSSRLFGYLKMKLILVNNNHAFVNICDNMKTNGSTAIDFVNVVYDISSRTVISDLRIENPTQSITQDTNQSFYLSTAFLLDKNTVITLSLGTYQRTTNNPPSYLLCLKTDTGFAKIIPKSAYMSPYINKMR